MVYQAKFEAKRTCRTVSEVCEFVVFLTSKDNQKCKSRTGFCRCHAIIQIFEVPQVMDTKRHHMFVPQLLTHFCGISVVVVLCLFTAVSHLFVTVKFFLGGGCLCSWGVVLILCIHFFL